MEDIDSILYSLYLNPLMNFSPIMLIKQEQNDSM